MVQAFLLLICLSGCFKDSAADKNFTPTEQKLYNKGRAVYKTVCIACHNGDPKLPGVIGPENYGSSLELLKLKVLQNKYPPGYKPKRPTNEMHVSQAYASIA